MNPRVFVALAVIISFSVALCLSNAFGWYQEYQKSFALSSFAETCEIIVVGRVVQKDYVERVLDPADGQQTTTDITVAVTEVVKGTPNAGKKKVKFMYLGGVYTDPIEDVEIQVIHTDQPEFSVGEEVLLFLNKRTTERYALWPHGRFTVHRRDFGKKLIVNNEIMTVYAMEDDCLKPVVLPLALALKLLKAADKDKEKIELLEQDIIAAIKRNIGDEVTSLSDAVKTRLSNEAQKIIDKHSQSQTTD